jgi:asparaginyl-tRNA synthetase
MFALSLPRAAVAYSPLGPHLLQRAPGYAAAPVAASAAVVRSQLVRCSSVEAAPTPTGELQRQKVGSLVSEGTSAVGNTVLLKGWVRTVRAQKDFSFIEINDGSSLAGLQVVAKASMGGYAAVEGLTTGAAVAVVGEVVPSKGKGQEIEVQATSVEVVGDCPADTYPLQKKRHSLEFLRTIAHLRPRSNLFGAVSRVRSTLAQATHAFFASEGFRYVQTPILTASDCEGAGEMFRVTTLDPTAASPSIPPPPAAPSMNADALAKLEEQIAAQGTAVREVKEAKKAGTADKTAVDAAVAELLALKAQLPGADGAAPAVAAPAAAPDASAFADDFFGKQAFLTVSGQLSAETYACALGDVYTFGPTFRAEDSNTARHLAEFWMIEPEMAFADLNDDMDNAERYVKYVVKQVLDTCPADMEFFSSFVDKELMGRLTRLVDEPFARVSYSDAVDMLQEEIAKDPSKWEFPEVEFGTDLSTEHERWLAETKFKTAVFVYNYPKCIKAFYMRDNDGCAPGKETVAAMDLLVPGIGELIGGSQREERLDRLREKMAEVGLDEEDYWWYVDLRKYGTVPHAGYGLGFERLVCYVTGVANIRDAIAFPRYPGSCDF